MMPRLGVNIDHIATLRQLRGTPYPDLLEAARLALAAGAYQITIHLREDRRHIQPQDVKDLTQRLGAPINLEMACNGPVLKIALQTQPQWVCLVPERRQEQTTEGGLNFSSSARNKKTSGVIQQLKKSKIRVSTFIEPTLSAVRISHQLGADAVELHTGRYALQSQGGKSGPMKKELEKIHRAAEEAHHLGLSVHAGHGLDFENVRALAEFSRHDGSPLIAEYNIGHSIVCRSAIVGLDQAVREMVSAIVAP